MVLAGLNSFRWFWTVLCFSEYGTYQCWLRSDVLIFCANIYFILLTFVQNFYHFDSQASETLE